jgi:hypothetical protein
MADDWVKKRHQRHEEAVEVEKQKQMRQRKALDSYGALFCRLQKRVEQDVEEYNRLFTQHGYRARFTAVPDQFSVTCKSNGGVTVTKTTTALINVVWKGDVADVTLDSIEVVVDDQNEVRCRHDGKMLADLSEVSEFLLDRVLHT